MSCLSGLSAGQSGRPGVGVDDSVAGRFCPDIFQKLRNVRLVRVVREREPDVFAPEVDELGLDQGVMRPPEGFLLGTLIFCRADVVVMLAPLRLAADAGSGW